MTKLFVNASAKKKKIAVIGNVTTESRRFAEHTSGKADVNPWI
jgi:hypothetical protein